MNTERSFKCRICGGEVTWEKGSSMGECIYCGSKQPIPSNLTAHTQDLYNDAFEYLKKNEYDKAFVVYENIIKENPNDAEAYWGRCLCRYGIEYVDDPNTGKKIPTCHRLQAKSILKDEDYLSALKYAPDEATKSLYTMRATTIDVIQRDIISISQGEEGKYDIFISFKDTDNNENRTKDSHLAEEIYNELTKQGYKVFFSRVTLAQKLGAVYEPYIYAAIHSAKIMIIVGTKPEHIESAWVRNEWSRYLDLIREGNDKKLIVCFKDMSRKALPEEFVPFQNLDMNERGSMVALVQNIEKIVTPPKKDVKEATPKKEKRSGGSGCLLPLLIILGILGVVVFFAWEPIIEDFLWPNQYEHGVIEPSNTENNNQKNPFLSGELTQIQLHVDEISIMYGDTVHLSFSTYPDNPTQHGEKAYDARCIEYYIRINGVDKRINEHETDLDYVVEATGDISFWAKYCHHSTQHSDAAEDVVSNEVKITVVNENGLYYKDNDDGVKIVKYGGSSANLSIPSSIDGRTVNAIGESAFLNCSTLQTIIVPDSVTKIGFGAFSGCNSLAEITLPFVGNYENATKPYWATFGYIFGDGNLSDTTIDTSKTQYTTSGATGYTSQAYDDENSAYMTYFAIPRNIRKVTITKQSIIPVYAFQNCDLIKEITFTSQITDVGMQAFQKCSALTACHFEVSDSTIIGEYAFQNCSSLTSFCIPEGVIKISAHAFADCTSMKAIEIPNTAERIAHCAFKNCVGLTAISVPDSVVAIDYGTFRGCDGLVEMTLPFVGRMANATEARWAVFGYIFGDKDPDDSDKMSNSKTKYTTSGSDGYTSQSYGEDTSYMYYFAIPKSIKKVTVTKQTTVPAYAFQNCDLINEIAFEKAVTYIDAYAFSNAASLINVGLSGSENTVIQSYAFANCDSLTEIVIPNGVTELGEYAYSNCDRLKKVIIPGTVTRVGGWAFSGCITLTDIVISDGVEIIDQCAFKNCVGLTSVIVPNSVSYIVDGAFSGCNGLVEMTLPFVGRNANAAEARWAVFGYIFGDKNPDDDDMELSNTKYSTSGADKYTSQSYGENTKYMYYFSIPKSIRKVTITNQTNIPAYAFQNCDLIFEIAFEKELLFVDKHAFENCSSLSLLKYRMGSGSIIQEYAFANCDSIEEISVQEGVLKIGEYAFSGSDSLKTVNMPLSLQSIENCAFSDCSALTDVNIQYGCKSIKNFVFKNCEALQFITIPESVNEIGWAVFYGCNSLKEITIPFVGKGRSVEQMNYGTLGYIFGDDSPEDGKMATSNYHTIYKTSEGQNMTTQAYSHSGSGYHQGSSIYYTAGVDYYCYYAIPKSLRKVIVTDQTTVPAYAFRNCDLLTAVTFLKNIDTVGTQAFENCSTLKTIFYGGSQAEWNEVVFGTDWNKNADDFNIIYKEQ